MYEIEIFGSIVSEKTAPNQITMEEIRMQLREAQGEEVLFLINSGGGSVINGTAILDEMDRYPSTINSHIMGICGSMATAIASKSQYVSMNSNALYMIHNPRGGAVGEVKDMERTAKNLRMYTDNFVSMYMAKTGLDEDKIRSMMNDITYMNADEALKYGFVNEITDALEMTAEMEDFIFGMDEEIPEQARAYFKQKQTETNMSEEKQEKGILDKIVALINGNKKVDEPVQEEVVAEASVDFEAKFNELDVEMKAQIEAKDAELAELKASHKEAVASLEADHKAQLEEVVAKVEVIVKAFEDNKLSVHEAKEELKSEAKSDEVEAKLNEAEDKFSADVEKESIEANASEYDMWMSIEDTEERQKYYREHSEKIDAQYELSK